MSQSSNLVEYDVRPDIREVEGQKVSEDNTVKLDPRLAAYHVQRGRLRAMEGAATPEAEPQADNAPADTGQNAEADEVGPVQSEKPQRRPRTSRKAK